MITTALALLAATLVAENAPAQYTGGSGPITASAQVGSDVYCIRSGWNVASFQTRRRVRRGECLTAKAWRSRGVEFETATTALAKNRAAGGREIAAR